MPSLEFSTPLPRKMTEPIEQAVHDLTARLGVAADEIELVRITTEEMPAGDPCFVGLSKGTAQPGGLVLGKEVVLRVGGETYTYRIVGKRVALCWPSLSGEAPASSPAALPEGSEVALEAAIADLASRLNIPEADIRVASVEKRMWSDASLGCPQPGMMYAQVITPGFIIRLSAQGKVYTYHTSLTWAVLCEP